MPEDVATPRACVRVSERWALGRAERFALCHGDYRLDNLLFPPGGAFGLAYGTCTTRGNRMFAAMVSRCCGAIRDLDTLARV